MSDLRVRRETSSVTRFTDDHQWMNLRGTRDGAMVTADWLTAMALEGRCFGCNTGTGTLPDTMNPGSDATGVVATEQDLYLPVPSGTTIIPVFIEVCLEDTGTTLAADIFAIASSTYDADTTEHSNPTVYNMRMDAPHTSAITAMAVISAGGTSPYSGNYIEFWRGFAGIPADAFAGNTTPTSELTTRTAWSIKDSLVPPVIVGEGSLSVYANTEAAIGFITCIWVEIPSTSIQ